MQQYILFKGAAVLFLLKVEKKKKHRIWNAAIAETPDNMDVLM